MGWNYRLVKVFDEHTPVTESYLEIKEVYYDEEGKIEGFGAAPVPYGETLEDIKECLELLRRALDKPIIDYETMEEIS